MTHAKNKFKSSLVGLFIPLFPAQSRAHRGKRRGTWQAGAMGCHCPRVSSPCCACPHAHRPTCPISPAQRAAGQFLPPGRSRIGPSDIGRRGRHQKGSADQDSRTKNGLDGLQLPSTSTVLPATACNGLPILRARRSKSPCEISLIEGARLARLFLFPYLRCALSSSSSSPALSPSTTASATTIWT